MLNQISHQLAPPVFEDEDKTRIARWLNAILLVCVFVAIFYSFLAPFIDPNPLQAIAINGIMLAIYASILILLRRGRVALASMTFVWLMWLIVTLAVLAYGTILSPGFVCYFAVIAIAGLLRGGQAALVFAGLTILATLGIVYAEETDLLPPPILPINPVIMGWVTSFNFVITALTTYLALRSVTEALGHARQELTERQRAEEAYRALVEHSVQGLLIYQDGRIVFMNPRMYEMLGYTNEEIYALEDPIPLLLHPEDLPMVQDRIRRLVRRELETSHQDVRAFHKQGQERWLEAYGSPITYQGKPAIQSAVIDITERKRVEAALRVSEERYRALYQDNPSMFFTLDAGGTVISVNEFGASQLGYAIGELEGQSVLNVFFEADHAVVMEQLKTCLQHPGQNYQWQLRKIRKDGSLLWVEEFARAVNSPGGLLHILVVCQDITARKQTEEALQASEERYRLISELISDYAYLYRVAPDGTWTMDWMIGSPIDLTGYDIEELSQPIRIYHPDDDQRARQDVDRTFQGVPTEGDYRVIAKEGETRWIHIRRQPVWDTRENRFTHFYAAVQDITDRKQAEAQALELALAQEREASLRDFLGTISHDLKTPLSVIDTSLYLLERIADPEKQQDRINSIRVQAQLLERYIQDILTISRLDHTPTLARKPVDLNRLLRDIVGRLRPSTEQKHLTTLLDLSPDLAAIVGDENELDRVLVNLIENAVRYTPDGGSIHVQTRPEDGWAVTEIADSGIGIQDGDLPHIFERFYRAEEAKVLEKRGTGLGLAIVKKIVELHDGSIEAHSVAGRGTTFSVWLPVVQRLNHIPPNARDR
jgi:PAS domain S-box-containing protein